MEKGISSKLPETSNYLLELHQAIQDGQHGLISFEDVRDRCRSRAIAMLEQTEEGQKFLVMNVALSSPEQ